MRKNIPFSIREINQHLHNIVLAGHECRPGYLRVFDQGIHPSHLEACEIPVEGDVLVHFHLDYMYIDKDKYRAVNYFYSLLEKATRQFDVFVDVDTFRLGAFDVACTIRGSLDHRQEFMHFVSRRVRESKDLSGRETFGIGHANPYEGAYLVQMISQQIRFKYAKDGSRYVVNPQDSRTSRGLIVHMMHEVALRKRYANFLRNNLFVLGQEIRKEKWTSWNEVTNSQVIRWLPPSIHKIFTSPKKLCASDGATALQKLHHVGSCVEKVLTFRVNELLGEETGLEDIYEWYATVYLLHDMQNPDIILGRMIQEDVTKYTSQWFVENELSVDLSKPVSIERKSYGPEHYGYSIEDTPKWE